MLKKVLLVLILTVAFFALVGCQTVQGLGRDITWIGSRGDKVMR